MLKKILFLLLFFPFILQASPIKGLLERIDKDASSKFIIEYVDNPNDFFEIDQKNNKVVIRGNNHVSIATGINWYLKYYANIHLSWNCMKAKLPKVLPKVTLKERHESSVKYRYALNYCTFSYSMAFWDWNRWEREIDWMALHGINLPLAITGTGVVWRNLLKNLGYSQCEIDEIIAGPAFQPWFLMNNLEGWGGPNTVNWYDNQEKLQKKILKRMREYGMEPVLPGYSGMVPSNSKEKLSLNIKDTGNWCGFRRPAILRPTDRNFSSIADAYYKELTKLYGKANFYSMDPFHEGGSVEGVDLEASGKAILSSMKKVNKNASWIIQAWQACPYNDMIKNLPKGDVIVLDLWSESRPQWGEKNSVWYRKDGFGKHDWVYCMLLNFGANIGLHGKMDYVINEFYKAKNSRFGLNLKGIGMTPEGIENNPVMYELLMELPWREIQISKEQWIKDYIRARYGKNDNRIEKAWDILINTIYNCPSASTQEGPYESIFTARPSFNINQISNDCSGTGDYYNPHDIIHAVGLFLEAADDFRGNDNYEYDLVDFLRQAIAEKGRLIYPILKESFKAKEKEVFSLISSRILELILLQDKLLSTRSEFKVGLWIEKARNMGINDSEKDWYEWNARVLITTWGNDKTYLHDYAQRENNGLLKDFYYKRWKAYFEYLSSVLEGDNPSQIDFYNLEEKWTKELKKYSFKSEGDAINIAKDIYFDLMK